MSYHEFSDVRRRIDACLNRAALVLQSNREAVLRPADAVQHRYSDKYLLADHLTNTASVCYLNALKEVGLSRTNIIALKSWSGKRAVSLKFERKQRCQFVREIEKDVEDPTRIQTESLGGLVRSTVKVITKVKEYIYTVEESYELKAYSGVGDVPAENIVIASRSVRKEVTTRSSAAPFQEASSWDLSVNVTWLLRHLDDLAENATFRIDRAHPECATPRRNPDVEAALQQARGLASFCHFVHQQLQQVYNVHTAYGNPHACKFDLTQVQPGGVFSPVVPLFDEHAGPSPAPTASAVTEGTAEGSGTVMNPAAATASEVALPGVVVNQLLQEHRRSLAAACAGIDSLFEPLTPTPAPVPAPAQPSPVFFTAAEARLMLAMASLAQVAQDYTLAVDFIEQMIRSQLVAAIGREVTMRDFSQYMIFHNRKVFREEFMPRPFSYAVRRSAVHSPEGQLEIAAAAGWDGNGSPIPEEPIYTVSQTREDAAYMEFELNATTTVQFGGERHLHGWMGHRFSGQALPELKLVAQARQFSSFIVLIGRIASAKVFLPKYAFIAQNKDEFSIPLELEQIPTAKEFRDAISSLSPEQQRFAKAYRSMQLESTLFAVCVVQIKPQLEKVLKLSADSLTKEIKLTQDLVQLFIKYQIPTDLLSYQEGTNQGEASPAERLAGVKRHVAAVQEMLAAARAEEVAAAKELRVYEGRERESSGSDDHSNEDEEMTVEEAGGCFDDYEGSYGGEVMMLETCAAPAPKRSNFGSSLSKMVRRLSASAPSVGGPAPGSAAPPVYKEKKMMKKSADREDAPQKREMTEDRKVAAPRKNRAASPAAAVQPQAVQAEQSQQPSEPAAESAKPEDHPEAPEDDHGDQQQQGGQAEQEHAELLVDYTKYPNKLEDMCGRYDPDSCLRPTIINPGSSWTKSSQAGLLAKPTTAELGSEEQTKEKEAAFELLDALTRSGALAIEHAALHVVIAATHCFDQSVMDTLVQKNVNPIERVERSTLIMASTLSDVPALALVQDGQADRIAALSPLLQTQVQEQGLLRD